jgi:hypothetical protein
MRKQTKNHLEIIMLRGLMLVALILAAMAIPRNAQAQGDVIITEVAFKASPDWAEIYNTGASGVDISGYMLTDLDGTDTVFASSVTTLGAGEHAVIHWMSGTDETDAAGDGNGNGYIDLYVEGEDLTGTDDQLVLVNAAGAYIDAVIWSNNDDGGPLGEPSDFNALAPDEWNYDDVANSTDWAGYNSRSWIDSDSISAGESLARDIAGGYVDTNLIDDWHEETNPVLGETNDPTAITLARFEASSQADAALVEWETAIEIDNVGFNLYRSTLPGGPYVKLNGAVIPSQWPGSVWGAVYTWLDEGVEPGVTYYYKLEDIEVGGVRAFHGPVGVSVQSPTALSLTSFAAQGGGGLAVLLATALMAGSVFVFRRRK